MQWFLYLIYDDDDPTTEDIYFVSHRVVRSEYDLIGCPREVLCQLLERDHPDYWDVTTVFDVDVSGHYAPLDFFTNEVFDAGYFLDHLVKEKGD